MICWQWQSWPTVLECGPTTTVMTMSFGQDFGHDDGGDDDDDLGVQHQASLSIWET